MDETKKLRRKMRVAYLEARLASCEINYADMDRIIDSPLTNSGQRDSAIVRRDILQSQRIEIKAELDAIRNSKLI